MEFVGVIYYHGSPIRKVLLSNVIEIANSYLDNVREEDLSEWRSMVYHMGHMNYMI